MDELIQILTGADEFEPEIAHALKLATTTGMQQGELSGLRRSRFRPKRNELVVDTAVNDAGGTVVIKPTKTKRSRVVSLDEATVEMLEDHIRDMDARADECGVEVVEDPFVFSLNPTCGEPMRPEFMTRHMRLLRSKRTPRPHRPGDA